MSINIFGPLKLLDFNDRVDKATQKERLAICLSCDKAELGICKICLCPLAAKSWIASEECPIGKWKTQEPSQ